jgi:hypothetical protein
MSLDQKYMFTGKTKRQLIKKGEFLAQSSIEMSEQRYIAPGSCDGLFAFAAGIKE